MASAIKWDGSSSAAPMLGPDASAQPARLAELRDIKSFLHADSQDGGCVTGFSRKLTNSPRVPRRLDAEHDDPILLGGGAGKVQTLANAAG